MRWPNSLLIALLASLAGATAAAQPAAPWWQHAVIYEIYPRSFQDSDGDGTGDLNGITQRLDYLQALGVDAIWIAPMYPSPQVDFGYDVADYCNVDPKYGTLADFDRLLAAARRHKIRVLLDMVLNHTSDRHAWFVEAARSANSARHDWYVWHAGRPDSGGRPQPPNNWLSLFGGPAWEWLPAIQQYYYHKFYKQQPDLNWRNPEVEAAIFAAMRFWLDRGVAGFRLDAVTTLFEDRELRDEPATGGINAQGDPNLNHLYTDNLPEVHAVIRRMRAMLARYPGERVLIGELYVPNTAELDQWYGGEHKDELQLPMDALVGFGNRLDAAIFRQRLNEADTQLHGSPPLLVFDNHDNIRSWDRYGDGTHNAEIAKLIATLLLTSRSAALLYQGQELGQRTATPTRVEDVRDPIGVTGWPREKGRDGERTPMPWDGSKPQAGFSTNPHTWLPVTADFQSVNVATELADADSLLWWHRRLIAMRRSLPALRDGRVVMLDEHNSAVLAYARIAPAGRPVVVVLNLSPRPQTVSLELARAQIGGHRLNTLLASPRSMRAVIAAGSVELAPFAAWVARVE